MDSYVELCAGREGLDRAAAEKRAELVEWMAFHNPGADDRPTYLVVVMGDRVMGHLGRMPTRFAVDGRLHRASYFHDLYIDPELIQAGKGFFLSMKLYREAEKASPSYATMIWTNDINIRLQRSRKYHEMWFDNYVKLLRVDGHIDRQARERLDARLDIPMLKMAGKAAAATVMRVADGVLGTALTRRFGPGSQVVQIARPDERFDRFAEDMSHRMGIAPVKTRAYLDWKYFDRPQLDVVCFTAVDDRGELRGFTVVHVPEKIENQSYIVELCGDPEDAVTMSRLIVRAVEHCRSVGGHGIGCVATDPRLQRLLKRFLFIPRPPRRPLFLGRHDSFDKPDVLTDTANWHVSYGDSEGPF